MLWNPKLILDGMNIDEFQLYNSQSHIRRISSNIGLALGSNPSPYHSHDCRAVIFLGDKRTNEVSFVRFQYEFVPEKNSDIISIGARDLIEKLNCTVKPLSINPSRNYLESRFSQFGTPISLTSRKGDSFIYIPSYLTNLPDFLSTKFDTSKIRLISQ